MAITKTRFLEYTRCPKYVFLEKVKKESLHSIPTYEEYCEEEKRENLREILSSMIEVDSDGNVFDKTQKKDPKLDAMLSFYKQVEVEALKVAAKYFEGKIIGGEETSKQICFSTNYQNTPLLCYVDLYNENDQEINIIEVKATTMRKYRELAGGYPKKWKHSIFKKKKNIYFLKETQGIDIASEMPLKTYQKERAKLLDRYSLGNYVYDLAFQRFVIEHDPNQKNKPIHYYLAVLNDAYTFSGKYQNGEALYEIDENNEELITFISCDEITYELQSKIEEDLQKLFENMKNTSLVSCPLSTYCGYKKVTCCKFFESICGKEIPKANSSLSYMNNPFGFVKEDGTRIKGLDLINEGYFDLLDVPEAWITKENHKIQRECYQSHEPYMNKEKLEVALNSLEYPIYHLDFETFPCPLPRFRGEHPYTQSPFEFSLHIEHLPGVCDYEKDHVVFLAKTFGDEREELICKLLQYVDVNKGTLFAQNVAFEKGRIKELAQMFPKYQKDLMKLHDRGFDLLWILNNNQEFYKEKGFTGKDLETCNFYDEKFSGSFSIKKTLPVFSSLSYQDLEVKNGNEAIVVYANYPKMSKEEFLKNYQALEKYCTQDTWAMVEILDSLRKKLQNVKKSSKKVEKVV